MALNSTQFLKFFTIVFLQSFFTQLWGLLYCIEKCHQLLFFSFYSAKCKESKWVKNDWAWTHTGTTLQFFCEMSLSFCPLGQNLPGYIIFWMPTQIFVVTSPTCCLHVACGHTSLKHTTHTMRRIMLPSTMPPPQFMLHFYWGLLRSVYFRNQVTFPVIFAPSVWLLQLFRHVKGIFVSISNC